MKDDRPRAFAVLVAVFLIGLLLGAAGSFWLKPSPETSRVPEGRFQAPPRNWPPPKPPEFNLTPDQEEKLGKIWAETRERLQSLMHEQSEQMVLWDNRSKEIWADNDAKARAILDEYQKVKFDAYMEELRVWRDRAPRHRGPEMPMQKENRKKPERL